MCGRIYQTLPLSRLIAIARARMAANPEGYQSSYNVCPTSFIPAIRSNKRFITLDTQSKSKHKSEKAEEKNVQPSKEKSNQPQLQDQDQVDKENQVSDDYELAFSKWGLKTKYNLVINAKTQEMFMKPTFTKIIQNRCVVIMQGYYEWTPKKEPFLFTSKTSDHLLVAGLYNQDNEVVILTRDAVNSLKEVHSRMPVILSPDEVKLWLDPSNDDIISKVVEQCFLPKDKGIWSSIQMTKLAPYVNSVKEKSAKCIMNYEQYQKELDRTGIMRFFKKKEPIVQTIGADGEILTVTPSRNSKRSLSNEEMDEQEQKLRVEDVLEGKDLESTVQKSQQKNN